MYRHLADALNALNKTHSMQSYTNSLVELSIDLLSIDKFTIWTKTGNRLHHLHLKYTAQKIKGTPKKPNIDLDE